MEISAFLKSVINSDYAPVVICDVANRIVYANTAAMAKYGDYVAVGNSILDCHNAESALKINKVIEWFKSNVNNNSVHTFYNDKENKDVYMIALRDDNSELIGYYEKHEYRNRDYSKLYELN